MLDVPEIDFSEDAIPQPVDYYFVWLRGPLLESVRQELHGLGATLLESNPDGSYKARLGTQQVAAVQALPYVRRVQWIGPAETAPLVAFWPATADDAAAGLQLRTYDVRVMVPGDRPAVEAWLRARAVSIVGTGTRKVRFQALEGSALLNELRTLPEAAEVAEYVVPKLCNDRARSLLGVEPSSTGPAGALASPVLDGSGQLIGVADTGLDAGHPDFQGRIAKLVARGRPGDTSDPSGHGTHVAGSVLGSGAASGGVLRGVAPAATLFFQSLLDLHGGLGGLPVDLTDLLDEAYQAGVRIHNNSWGSETASMYTTSSEEVDEFVHQHRDMLVVIAAGNAGISGVQPTRAAPGFVDWLSIGSPASSKNALTVGASRSDRANSTTWGSRWPSAFPAPPIAHELVSGDPECLAAFSSRGPCDDHRIKPDVVAPGTSILSTRSAQAPDANFWDTYPASAHYAFNSGTGMAAPLVTGCAALVRQYYQAQGHATPSAALLKATLVNSTTWLTGADSTAPTTGRPNFHQGHGRVSMLRAVPGPAQPGLELRFLDDWQTFQFSYTGQRKRYVLNLAQDCPDLRFCLAYTDAPGRSLQNNLNLLVQLRRPDGSQEKLMGNKDLPDALVLPDPDNNVECIRLEQAPAGTYFIQVFAANLLKPKQDFALVVTGLGLPALTEI